jgi:hypothetical protein
VVEESSCVPLEKVLGKIACNTLSTLHTISRGIDARVILSNLYLGFLNHVCCEDPKRKERKIRKKKECQQLCDVDMIEVMLNLFHTQ